VSVGFGPTIGAELGGYRLEALIGRGGMDFPGADAQRYRAGIVAASKLAALCGRGKR